MKKNNLIATIMSALGGIFFALPWFFLYVNANKYSYFAATLIPFGFYIFYTIFSSEKNIKIMKIIGLESIFIMLALNFLIIPVYSIKISNIEMRFDNFLFLYSFPEFRKSLFKNGIIGIIFIIFGTFVLSMFINKKKRKIK